MTKPVLTTGEYLKNIKDKETMEWIQSRLMDGGYLCHVDGLYGEKTEAALIEFKKDLDLMYVTAVGPTTIDALSRLTKDVEGYVPTFPKPLLLEDVKDEKAVKWIQLKLANGGYLRSSDIDGKVGEKTIGALSAFKKQAYLDHPTAVGNTTIKALQELMPKHELTGSRLLEQTEGAKLALPTNIGTRTGRSKTLPVVGKVFENQMIVANGFLTWGEMTRGFSRSPMATGQFGSEKQIVENMISTAKVFKIVRDKFGSPIRITSAYRPPNLNIGASRSQHKFARALDLAPINGDFKGLLQALKATPQVKGLGLAGARRGFWHMDIRPIAQRISFGY